MLSAELECTGRDQERKKKLSVLRKNDLTLPPVTNMSSLSNKLDVLKVIFHQACASPKDD